MLEGQTWKKKAITAKVAAPAVDPLYRLKERKRGGECGHLLYSGTSLIRTPLGHKKIS